MRRDIRIRVDVKQPEPLRFDDPVKQAFADGMKCGVIVGQTDAVQGFIDPTPWDEKVETAWTEYEAARSL